MCSLCLRNSLCQLGFCVCRVLGVCVVFLVLVKFWVSAMFRKSWVSAVFTEFWVSIFLVFAELWVFSGSLCLWTSVSAVFLVIAAFHVSAVFIVFAKLWVSAVFVECW